MTGPPRVRRGWARFGLGAAWIFGLAVAIVALRTLGHGGLSTPPVRSFDRFRAWLDQRDTPTAAFAFLRLGALVVATYLLAVTVAGLAARTARIPKLIRLADAATLPIARRLLATVAGLSVSASSAMLTLPLLPFTPAGPPVQSHRSAMVVKPGPGPHDDRTATMRVIGGPPAAPPPAPSRTSVVHTWTVAPGDSLWAVADGVLHEAWRRAPTDAEVVPYWHALIERNRGRLVDTTNADLVFPGQVFELPTPPPPP